MYKNLTVDEVRNKYWDKKRKIGKPIIFGVIQTFGGKTYDNKVPSNVDLDLDQIFIPDGSLHHKKAEYYKRLVK
jgi:hypothetical protein